MRLVCPLAALLGLTACRSKPPAPAVIEASCAAPALPTEPAPSGAPHDANDVTFAVYRAAECHSDNLVVSGVAVRRAFATIAPRSRLGYLPGPEALLDERASWEHATSELAFTMLASGFRLSAPWAAPFESEDGAFTLPGGARASVTMIAREGATRHADVGGVEVVELPLDGDRMTISFAMPIPSLPVDRTAYERWNAALRAESIRVHIPRFEVRTTLDAASLGKEVFGIDHAPVVSNDLAIAVDERGVGAPDPKPPPLRPSPREEIVADVTFDRPFLFFVRDRSAPGAPVLAMGRVVNPNRR